MDDDRSSLGLASEDVERTQPITSDGATAPDDLPAPHVGSGQTLPLTTHIASARQWARRRVVEPLGPYATTARQWTRQRILSPLGRYASSSRQRRRSHIADERQIQAGARMGRRGRRALLISAALLLILALPTILAISTGLNDYNTLKSLGKDGLAHLTAVKSDLLGSSGGAGSTSSLLSSAGGTSFGSRTLAELQSLLAAPGPSVTDPAYTYLLQRQGGTYYPATVTVHPASNVSSEGAKTKTWRVTLGSNSYFALGGVPKPTPTATPSSSTATPAPTATPGASSSTGGQSASASGGLSKIIPDQAKISAARQDLLAARGDFQALDAKLAHPDWALSLAMILPSVGSDLSAGRALARVGVDATSAGLAMLDAATPTMLRLHGAKSLFSGTAPLITQADITSLQQGLKATSAYVDDIVAQLQTVNVNTLPISASQKALFTQVAPLLPQLHSTFDQASQLLGVAGWLLGADTPRHILVQTLDRGELRATGGFTGQYGVVTLDGGKLGPISLQDVNCLDYLKSCLSNGWAYGRSAPAPYNIWWPFANWGLRDSNLSADFPTNARLVMDVYYHESGQHVDGLINISPLVIEDVLRVTGPIQVPLYNETITADNLETKLHYYQLNPAGVAREKQLSAGDNSTSTRKRFTQLVGQLLLERVKSLPLSQMTPLAKIMLKDMRSKNLEVYFANPAAEALLAKYYLDAAVNTTPAVDGYMLVQTNVSASKAATFVNVTQSDNVTLDAKGGATHHLTLTFHGDYTYNQVYGYMTYRNYLRIYVPPQSKLLSGDGFDSGTPMCWPSAEGGPPAQYASLPGCSGNPYPNGEMVCPSGNYAPGSRAPDLFGSNGYNQWPVDAPGGPTNTTSDLANRAMYGGYIFMPDGCTVTVTVSWYTPGVAPKA